MIIYLTALNRTVQENKNINNVSAVLEKMWNHNYNGVTGNIEIDNLGDRNVEFVLYDLSPTSLEFEPVITSSVIRNAKKNIEMILVYDEDKRPIYWKKNLHGKFPDSPKCGFNNAKCPKTEPLPIWVWLLIAMSVLMIIITTVGFIFYR